MERDEPPDFAIPASGVLTKRLCDLYNLPRSMEGQVLKGTGYNLGPGGEDWTIEPEEEDEEPAQDRGQAGFPGNYLEKTIVSDPPRREPIGPRLAPTARRELDFGSFGPRWRLWP